MTARNRPTARDMLRMSFKDVLVMLGCLTGAGLICALIRSVAHDGDYVSMLFILAVFLVARFTDGYLPGIISSFVAVLAVNYIFAYPYFHFDFTLSGYPLTILCMLAVSIITSAVLSRVKQSEAFRLQAEKEKTRSNLLRSVSHDLRTPLTAINGAISTVLEQEDALAPSQKAALLVGAQQDVQWLIRMVENLLAVTRIDGDSPGSIVKVPESVEDIISGAIRKFKNRFPSITMQVHMPEECLLIPVDAVLIEQVLLNLFENAIIHGKTTKKIILSVTQSSDKAIFAVQDDGIGIEKGKLSHLFDGFAGNDGETSGDQKRNMGIGLTVCNAIIQAHGGAMRGYNGSDGGAVIEFALNL